MVTKLLQIALLITTTLFLFGSSCDKNGSNPCTRITPYNFNVTSEFSPQKEIYNIGDTILLKSSFPKILINSISNQQVDYGNSIGVVGNIGIGLIDSVNNKFEVGTDYFNFVTTLGDITFGLNKVVNVLFKETNTLYVLELKIITKKSGNYIFGVSDLGSQGIKNKNCTNANFSMLVSNTNKFLHILTNANIPGVSLDPQRIATSYCFRVR